MVSGLIEAHVPWSYLSLYQILYLKNGLGCALIGCQAVSILYYIDKAPLKPTNTKIGNYFSHHDVPIPDTQTKDQVGLLALNRVNYFYELYHPHH